MEELRKLGCMGETVLTTQCIPLVWYVFLSHYKLFNLENNKPSADLFHIDIQWSQYRIFSTTCYLDGTLLFGNLTT